MTPGLVRHKVELIEKLKSDPEAAHSKEDELYRELLKSIATGTCPDAKECASEVLKSREIEFPRWCA